MANVRSRKDELCESFYVRSVKKTRSCLELFAWAGQKQQQIVGPTMMKLEGFIITIATLSQKTSSVPRIIVGPRRARAPVGVVGEKTKDQT
jgi:hypothetical protein